MGFIWLVLHSVDISRCCSFGWLLKRTCQDTHGGISQRHATVGRIVTRTNPSLVDERQRHAKMRAAATSELVAQDAELASALEVYCCCWRSTSTQNITFNRRHP